MSKWDRETSAQEERYRAEQDLQAQQISIYEQQENWRENDDE